MVTKAWRAVAERAFESVLLALAPPYTALIPVRSVGDGRLLPLGSVVVGVGDTTLAVLAALTQLTYSCPWAIPCLVLPALQEPLKPLLALVAELRDRLVVVNLTAPFRRNGDATTIIRGVRGRPLPPPTTLALWATHRLNNADLFQPLRSQFEMARDHTSAPENPSVATYSRLFRRYGPYTARDWRAIARLCWHAQVGILGNQDRRGEVRLPMRTVGRHATKYLEVSHHTITNRLGWEWVLEAALRAGGYV